MIYEAASASNLLGTTIPGKGWGPTKGQVPWFISQKGTYMKNEGKDTLTTPEKNELGSPTISTKRRK